MSASKGDKCKRCGKVGHDRRYLWMSCLYEMDELGLPFERHRATDKNGEGVGPRFYIMKVCKQCRADWMSAIKDWFTEYIADDDEDDPGPDGYYIRRLGATVKVSRAEAEAASACQHRPPEAGPAGP